jgi:DNA invertase Pin-like site-specific DNA recombinase
MKAIIFARVSSLIQEKEGYSLDAQIEKLRGYALSKSYHVLQEFKITESSNINERKKFNKVIEFVKSERKKSR